MSAGFYMHPALADASLHISLVPYSATTEPIQAQIPISLGALAIPGRRNELLRAPRAAAASAPAAGSNDVMGDMTVSDAEQATDAVHGQLRFCGLQSRAVSAGMMAHASRAAAASQVWLIYITVWFPSIRVDL